MSPLKKKRMSMGLEQRELAKRIGVAPATYNAWELGKRDPEPGNVSRLAKALKMSMEDVVELLSAGAAPAAAAATA